jgi:hypothetical protein
MPAEKWESCAKPLSLRTIVQCRAVVFQSGSPHAPCKPSHVEVRPAWSSTVCTGLAQLVQKQNPLSSWKTGRSTVESFREFIQQSIQIFVGLPLLVDLGDRMHHRGVVLAAELAADLRQ